jgi:hypothetical protein
MLCSLSVLEPASNRRDAKGAARRREFFARDIREHLMQFDTSDSIGEIVELLRLGVLFSKLIELSCAAVIKDERT